MRANLCEFLVSLQKNFKILFNLNGKVLSLQKILNMKKYALLTICLFVAYSLRGQCTVDTQTPNVKGLYPNPLPGGSIGSAYSQSVTMVFDTQSDTTINVPGFGSQTFTAYYTSFQVQQVSGIPQGLSMPLSSCNQPNCTYNIVQNQTNRGCMLLSGTPTESGTFQVTTTNYANGYIIMPITIPLTGLNAGDTVSFDDSRLSSIPGLPGIISGFRTQTYTTTLQINTTSTLKPLNTIQATVYPNPGKNAILKWTSYEKTQIQIANSLGYTVWKTQIPGNGENILELPNLPKGLYIIQIQSNTNSLTLKWICE
jgi:hypothetical protein